MSPLSPRPRADRVARACRNCRQRKVRCTGDNPCKDCRRLGNTCIYPEPQQRKRKAPDQTISDISGRPSWQETDHLWYAGPSSNSRSRDEPDRPVQSSQPGPGSYLSPTGASLGTGNKRAAVSACQTQDTLPFPGLSIRRTSSREEDREWEHSTISRTPLTPHPRETASRSRLGISQGAPADGGGTSSEDLISQYDEPWSWTSICSETGSTWVWTTTGSREFITAAKRFAKDMARRTSYDKHFSVTISSPEEINEVEAWEYVNAFFQNCWEADLGLIDRKEFETQLKSHYRKQKSKSDPAWIALRNIVFAGGCRSLLARDSTVSFAAAQAKAGHYFTRAVSVLTSLLVPPPKLMSVRALSLMACYVEGPGDYTFKHLLCSIAVHLAQSIGLHRQPDKSGGKSKNEILSRSWLWWALYALEKQLAFCGSRPSVIVDDNISIDLPSQLPSGSNIQVLSLSIGFRFSKIQSQLSRQLLSLKALSLSASELIKTVSHFHGQLMQLLNQIPEECRVGTLASPPHSAVHLAHILYLHFSIYGSLMAIHAHFFYPWMTSRFSSDGYNAAVDEQITSSSSTVAEAARKIILGLRLVNSNLTTPSWLAYHYPICAVVNLCIYILKYPELTTATADLGLLDVCAGHFGYMEFLTASQVSIALAREAANVASNVVKRTKSKGSSSASAQGASHYDHSGGASSLPMGGESLSFDHLEPNTDVLGDVSPTRWNPLSSFDMTNRSASGFENFT